MPTQRLEGKRVEERVGDGERGRERKSTRTRERDSMREHFGSSFYMFFSSTWACPMQIGLSQECCLFCLKSSLWSSDLPCLLATAILDSFSLFYLPNSYTFIIYFTYFNTLGALTLAFWVGKCKGNQRK